MLSDGISPTKKRRLQKLQKKTSHLEDSEKESKHLETEETQIRLFGLELRETPTKKQSPQESCKNSTKHETISNINWKSDEAEENSVDEIVSIGTSQESRDSCKFIFSAFSPAQTQKSKRISALKLLNLVFADKEFVLTLCASSGDFIKVLKHSIEEADYVILLALMCVFHRVSDTETDSFLFFSQLDEVWALHFAALNAIVPDDLLTCPKLKRNICVQKILRVANETYYKNSSLKDDSLLLNVASLQNLKTLLKSNQPPVIHSNYFYQIFISNLDEFLHDDNQDNSLWLVSLKFAAARKEISAIDLRDKLWIRLVSCFNAFKDQSFTSDNFEICVLIIGIFINARSSIFLSKCLSVQVTKQLGTSKKVSGASLLMDMYNLCIQKLNTSKEVLDDPLLELKLRLASFIAYLLADDIVNNGQAVNTIDLQSITETLKKFAHAETLETTQNDESSMACAFRTLAEKLENLPQFIGI